MKLPDFIAFEGGRKLGAGQATALNGCEPKHLSSARRRVTIDYVQLLKPASKAIGRTARKRAGMVYTWGGGRLIAPSPVPALTQSSEIYERIEARHRQRYG